MTERRRDPITGEWRTVATTGHDGQPAGSGSQMQPANSGGTAQQCPMCPTVDPASPTEVPWPAFDVAVFDSRLPPLTADPPPPGMGGVGVYRVEPALGAAEVVVYSDDHDASMATLGPERIRLLVDVWAERYAALGQREEIAYVFVFENRGEADGPTRHHPHGEVYGYPDVPPLPARELDAAGRHLARRGTCVQCDVVAQERSEGLRLIAQNDAFIAFVPFAARFPYEVHVVVQRHAPSLLDLSDPDRDGLALILHQVAGAYDRLFGSPLPYVMSMHQAPTDEGDWQAISHLHLEFTPFRREADQRELPAGSEVGAGAFLNGVNPEQAAAELRRVMAD